MKTEIKQTKIIKIDSLRNQLELLNTEIADLTEVGPVEMVYQAGEAEQDALFLYGLVGGKDVGKTSIINELAGAKISLDTDLLDEGTAIAVAYCHKQDLPALQKRLALDGKNRFRFVDHDREALKKVVFIDFPDFDSRFVSHREDTRRLVKHLQSLIWIATPRKYGDYEFLHQLESVAQSHENYLVVINKVDQLEKKVALDTFRNEVIAFLTGACVKRNVPPPDPEQFFMVSVLSPDQYEFGKMRNRLVRPHSTDEISAAKLLNLKAEFDKNLYRMRSSYELSGRLQEIDQALETIQAGIAAQFCDDYFKTVRRRVCTLETLQRRISKTIFAQRVKGWPILRILFYPLAAFISGFGGRLAFTGGSGNGPDSPRDLLRYEGVAASFRLQKIREDLEAAFPGLRRYLGNGQDLVRLVEDQFVQLLGDFEERVTDRLLESANRPGRLKRMLIYLPLIWFPFLQPLMLKVVEMKALAFSFSDLKALAAAVVSLFGAGSLLTSFVFLILFYTLWLSFLYAYSARAVQKKGEEEFQDLWYERFLSRLADALARPLLNVRLAFSTKKVQMEQIHSAVAAELERLAAEASKAAAS